MSSAPAGDSAEEAPAPDVAPAVRPAKFAGSDDDLFNVLKVHIVSPTAVRYKDAKKSGRKAPFQKSRIVALKGLMRDLRKVTGTHFT